MYARMVIFKLGPGMRTVAQTLIEGANVLYNAQTPGSRSSTGNGSSREPT